MGWGQLTTLNQEHHGFDENFPRGPASPVSAHTGPGRQGSRDALWQCCWAAQPLPQRELVGIHIFSVTQKGGTEEELLADVRQYMPTPVYCKPSSSAEAMIKITMYQSWITEMTWSSKIPETLNASQIIFNDLLSSCLKMLPPFTFPLEVLCGMMDGACHIKINWMVFPPIICDSLIVQQSF